MMFWNTGAERYLEKAEFGTGETQNNVNPGRGWYHIYTFRVGRPNEEQLRWLPFYEGETLALLRLDISDFRDGVPDPSAADYVRKIFEVFRAHGKEVILRFCYDTEGRGLEQEPVRFARVQEHIRYFGALAAEYAGQICVAQGLFVGSWGEMHSSRFLSPEQISDMAELWQEATEGKVRLAVRRPCQLRMLEEDVRAGLYDDALFGSESDLGTFGSKARGETLWEEAWRREDEIGYLRERCGGIPCGGEAVSGLDSTPEEMIRRLKAMQITYLNSIYDPARLENWKAQRLASGVTLYDYVGSHLGYCFVVTDVWWRKGQLAVTIANTGFANACDEISLYLVCGGERQELPADLTGLAPDDSMTMQTAVSGVGRLELEILRKKDGAVIRFANAGADERFRLGELKEKERGHGWRR